MKIVSDYPNTEMSLNQAIQMELDSADYHAGELETIKSEANNCVEMLGTLVKMLFDNRALTKENIEQLIGYGCSIKED